ncbi:hypothetical protein ACFRMQ_00880 [Kitasatospora sp. NPDC056783]|uniref:hypothetical protein n=1 Tax=Kitasatospora sp. NPDC056783 TaxID=3345943 RepID=UPI0036A60606
MPKDHAPRAKVRLIASEDADPQVRVPSGQPYEIVTATIVDSQLSDIAEETSGGRTLSPARLCGGRSTCIAVLETE